MAGVTGAAEPNTIGIVILVDADACPVKDEVYKVAERHGVPVAVVANAPLLVPRVAWIRRVHVAAGPDVADDWIAARAQPGTIVVTADIPLASRAVKAGATVIAPDGRLFTEASVASALATRNLMDSLRSSGEITGGPRPFAPRDRSAFLSAMETAVQRLKRSGMTAGVLLD